MHDLIIIGGGPAGVAAGVYAARKKLKTLILAESLNGQSSVSPEIQNWIGEITISGVDLAKKLESHLRSYESGDFVIKTKEQVSAIKTKAEGFEIVSTGGDRGRALVPVGLLGPAEGGLHVTRLRRLLQQLGQAELVGGAEMTVCPGHEQGRDMLHRVVLAPQQPRHGGGGRRGAGQPCGALAGGGQQRDLRVEVLRAVGADHGRAEARERLGGATFHEVRRADGGAVRHDGASAAIDESGDRGGVSVADAFRSDGGVRRHSGQT